MKMNKILAISVLMTLGAVSFFMITNQVSYEGKITNTSETQIPYRDTTSYQNHIEFNQNNLHLKKEAAQFKITFHQDSEVDVSSIVSVFYVDETITSAYCLLTNGEKPLLTPQCQWYVPERKYLLITPHIRISVGKYWVAKLFPDTIGSADTKSGHFDVHEGESWYLTLAVPTTSEKTDFSVSLSSLHDSMEVVELPRQRNLDLFVASFNQFSGRYYAVKLGVLLGGSICNVAKEITVRNGAVFHLWVAAHKNAEININVPNGEQRHFNKERLMAYVCLGNETGTWKCTVKGWSFYFRMVVILFYIDIDPHCNVEYFEQ
jgi:hypothetical protein